MRAVVQRVSSAAVSVDDESVGAIGVGMLVLVGAGHDDTTADADALAAKLAGLRIFADDEGRMNRSILDVRGGVLLVSQFTLLGRITRGRRPSFTDAADPDLAEPLVTALGEALEREGVPVEHGVFGAKMAVTLTNDGPVTFVVDVADGRVR